MANNEKYLKPLIDICDRLVSGPDDCKAEITELRTYASKGAFYECHSFTKVLELLTENPKLKNPKKAELFSVLKTLVQEGSSNKDYIISKLYAYIITLKEHPHLTDGTFEVCKFESELPNTNYDTLIKINEVLLRYATKDHLNILWSNYSKILCNQENVTTKQWQSFVRSVNYFASEKQWELADEFLRKTLLLSAVKKKIKELNQQHFEELFNIMKIMCTYSTTSTTTSGVCASLCQHINQLTTNEDHKQCLEILTEGLQLIEKGSISTKGLNKLSVFFPSSKDKNSTSSVIKQNTTVLLSNIFEHNSHLFESTAEAFEAYHKLSFKFFHVFRDLKNAEGFFSCCSDCKRHRVYEAIKVAIEIATTLAKENKFDKSISRSFQYQVNYCVQVCKDTKCSKKQKWQQSLFDRLFNFILEFHGKKESIRSNLVYLDLYIKVLFVLWNETKSKLSPENLAYEIYHRAAEDPEQTSAIYSTSASAMLSLLSLKRKQAGGYLKVPMATKKLFMKNMFAVRSAVKHLKCESVAEFVRSKYFVDPEFDGGKFPADEVEFLLMEVCAVVRHDVNEDPERVAKLYTEIFKTSKDSKILAEACQGMKDSVLKFIDSSSFKKVDQTIRASNAKQFNFNESLALALNSYSNYFVIFEAVSTELKTEGVQLKKNHMEREIEQLKHLKTSLEHFTDVVQHLIKNPSDLAEIFSMRRVQSVLNNMAIEYFKRGIKYKDVEAFTVLWNLAKMDGQSVLSILGIGTFILDHHQQLKDLSGNYVKVSKKLKPLTVEEVIETVNELLDNKLIPEFKTETQQVRGYTFCYMISLWVFYTTNDRKVDGFKRWNQFNELWKAVEVPAGAYRDTILSKIYFGVVEINLKCFSRFLHNYLSMAINLAVGVQVVDGDFISQFCINYYRITLAAINYSNNRLVDMSQYEVVMLSVIAMAIKKGYCFKYIDLLSLSITRYLNMERVDLAMEKLKDITRMLGLKEEILIETPKEKDISTRIFDFNEAEMHIREAAVSPKNKIHCEISIIEDRATELSRKLESFVHKTNCKCDICKIPQLKFVMFQIGCHYSRLLWLQKSFEISYSFNSFAMEPWREICDKMRRVKDSEFLMINKVEFAVCSIRWLFQCADTLIRLKNYSEVEDVYQEIELLNNKHIVDHQCFNQALFCRKEILTFLQEHDIVEEKQKQIDELSFTEFLKSRKQSQSGTPPTITKMTKAVGALSISKPASKESAATGPVFTTTRTVKPSATIVTKPASSKTAVRPTKSKSPATTVAVLDEAIYIDSSDDDESPVPQKIRRAVKKSPDIPSFSVTAAKLEPTPMRSTRKAKTDKTVDELRDNSDSTRKTRRRMI